MSAKIIFRTFYALTALTILVGCGSAPAEVPTQPPAEPAPTTVPPTLTHQQPTQVVKTAITPKPTPSVLIATRAEQFIGTWKFGIQGTPAYVRFEPDGNFNLIRGDAPPGDSGLSGKFSFDGKIFTIESGECPGVVGKYEAPMIYQQTGVNFKITFKVIEDACEARVYDYKKGLMWQIPQPE